MKKTPHVKSTIDLIRDFGAQISDAIVRAWQIGDPNAVRMLAHLYKYTACVTIELEKHVSGGHDAFLMKVLRKDLALFLKTETFLKYQKLGAEGKSDLITDDTMKSIRIMEDCLEALHSKETISDEAD
jgi:hypothetical protein